MFRYLGSGSGPRVQTRASCRAAAWLRLRNMSLMAQEKLGPFVETKTDIGAAGRRKISEDSLFWQFLKEIYNTPWGPKTMKSTIPGVYFF